MDTSDHALREQVVDELAWDALVDESQLDVNVADGVVTLVGTVGSYAQKLAARAAAASVDGVHDLVDDIDVKAPDRLGPSDADLKVIAERVLAWDALVPEQHLEVSVADGWVTLTGAVAVDSQRREAERAIVHLAGVRNVTNRIRVAPPSLGPDHVRQAIEEALLRRATHRAAHIDVAVDGHSVTLTGEVQTEEEKAAILGAVTHAPGIDLVCDSLTVGH